MKYPIKSVGLLLALLLIFFVLPLTVSAVENSYGFQYAPSALLMEYGENVPYSYVTPFGMSHTVSRKDGTVYYSGSCFPRIFNLINMNSGGDGICSSVAAYCVEPSVGLREGTGCRRINLEDGFDGNTAGKLRAVVLHSFPYKSITALQVRANAWLRRQGLPQIEDLQSGEAILATQAALWKLACGDRETIHSLFIGAEEVTAYTGKTLDTAALNQRATSHTARNVESLYTYLWNLVPESPKKDTVSEASLEETSYSAVRERNGTYTVHASVNVRTTVGPKDSLTLTASCGGQVQEHRVRAAGEYRFSFRELPEQMNVELELYGQQGGADVYLFEPEGGTAQALVGYDDSRQSVSCQLTVGTDRERSLASAPNTLEGEQDLGIQLDVSKAGCGSASFAVGEDHIWIIRGCVPEDLRNAKGYEITAVLDSRLTYGQESPKVYLYTRTGDPLPLRREDHYLLEEVNDHFFRISLTPAGMAYVSSNLGRGDDTPELHIHFQAAINEKASLGEPIPNMVHLTYVDPDGNEKEADSGISEVHTGGITLWNTDSEESSLPGAIYRLARTATEAEQADPGVETTFLNVGEVIQTVVYVPFYASAELDGGQVWEVTTGEDGRAAFCGLAYGSYYLVQMQPSNGYLLETKPIPVTVSGSSHLPEQVVKVYNTKINLPKTGGMGTGIFYLSGTAVLASAAFLLFTNRKRRYRK
ncbi:MAG: SpaA isopeptide-forming pilin-related protein [Faecousia sp.]